MAQNAVDDTNSTDRSGSNYVVVLGLRTLAREAVEGSAGTKNGSYQQEPRISQTMVRNLMPASAETLSQCDDEDYDLTNCVQSR